MQTIKLKSDMMIYKNLRIKDFIVFFRLIITISYPEKVSPNQCLQVLPHLMYQCSYPHT